MVDAWGWRMKFGVITPSTNTIVQPHYDAMAPQGVTNHISRMHIPDDPVGSDEDFDELIRRIDVAIEDSIDRVLTCRPDHLILGISAESIWGGGSEPARKIEARIKGRNGAEHLGVTQAATALPAALKALGDIENIAIVCPYYPVAIKHLQAFADEFGYNLVRTECLACDSPVNIAHVPEQDLRDAILKVDGDDIDAIVQFGANLPMAHVAAEAEKWLRKPVIAVMTAVYWEALRTNGIHDRIQGFGRLLEEH
ncbi:MAG: IgiC [Pseudomonadota bacterium]|nr:IgiC [Pseudomonadota bacterium]